jgi:glycosyltransferase involved in cell wall biosynthesis
MTDVAKEPRIAIETDARRPSIQEIAGAILRMLRRRSNPWGVTSLDDLGAAAILSRDPLVIYTAAGRDLPLGLANGLRRHLAGRPATFLIAIHGSIERLRVAKRIRRAAFVHRARHPEHRFIVLCNTKGEQRILSGLGEHAEFFNHNFLIGTDDFFPIANSPVKYDAVYNGRLSPQKRHHLSLKVDSCAMIFFRSSMEDPTSEGQVIEQHTAEAPGHVFINEIGPDGPIRLPPDKVNEIYNQAHVGLCLSEVEGAMYSSIEYMLAGLPIASTHNRGGRDVYFDPEYCILTEPDPDAIRAAVLELKARRIPRDYIRQRTLAKIEADRQRFLAFLSALSVKLPSGAETKWPFPSKLVQWKPWKEFLTEI